jgi:hypothetical protein
MAIRCQLHAPATLYSPGTWLFLRFWYLFLLEAELPQVLMQPEILGKFKNSPHWVSNPRPSGLQHSTLTTKLPRTGRLFYHRRIVLCVRFCLLTCTDGALSFSEFPPVALVFHTWCNAAWMNYFLFFTSGACLSIVTLRIKCSLSLTIEHSSKLP